MANTIMKSLIEKLLPKRWLAGLWRNSDFLKLWGSLTITHFGGQVTFLALPLTAALMLNATPFEVGVLTAKDTGTVPADGMIGKSRRFDPGKGINCGENITTFTTGSNPNSSEVWFKAERVNTRVMAWGREQRDGLVALELQSPPRMKMVSGFCCADVEGSNAVVMTQWTHVVHTYSKDNSRMYINGRLEGVSTANWEPLNIESPARMYIGGWYSNYKFAGEIDGPGTTVVYTREPPPGFARPAGRLTADDIAPLLVPDVTAYVCGSSGFAEAASHLVVDLGVPVHRVRVERFGPTA
jgi:hypothetical protein